jgi:hypothetical protein
MSRLGPWPSVLSETASCPHRMHCWSIEPHSEQLCNHSTQLCNRVRPRHVGSSAIERVRFLLQVEPQNEALGVRILLPCRMTRKTAAVMAAGHWHVMAPTAGPAGPFRAHVLVPERVVCQGRAVPEQLDDGMMGPAAG